MAERFKGQVALVTGGSSGIGRAAAVAFAAEGASVVVAARREAESEETVQLIRDAGGEAIAVRTDVTVASEVEALIDRAVETYGRLDCAFNNAGLGAGSGPIHEVEEDAWDRVVDTNLKGVWLCMKYQVPQMLSQGGGAIVNTSSDAGLIGWSGSAVYTASKWGVIGLTKSAALQYIAEGIRINAVCPGFIRTPMTESRDPRAEERMIAATPAGRIGTVDEVVGAVLWLCSDEASFVVGHPLSMDGGTTSGMW
jgi:NAD(P)-dependent dehydrogenase (short-subunit alcohol dehydrogenase family)